MTDFSHHNIFPREKSVMTKSVFEGMNLKELFPTEESRQEEVIGLVEEVERNATYLLEVMSDIRKLIATDA